MINSCEKFGCLPSELYREDAELLHLLRIVELGTPPEADDMPDGYDEGYEEV